MQSTGHTATHDESLQQACVITNVIYGLSQSLISSGKRATIFTLRSPLAERSWGGAAPSVQQTECMSDGQTCRPEPARRAPQVSFHAGLCRDIDVPVLPAIGRARFQIRASGGAGGAMSSPCSSVLLRAPSMYRLRNLELSKP